MSHVEKMDGEISFLEVIGIIRKRAVVIASLVLVSTVASMIICKMGTKTYRSTAVVLPMGGSSPSSALGAMGFNFTDDIRGLFDRGASSAAKKLLLLLESRTVSERLARRLDLARRLFPELWDQEKGTWKVRPPSKPPTVEDAGAAIRGMMVVTEDKSRDILNVTVESTDPTLAADLANSLVEELHLYLQDNEFSDAKRSRVFIGRQLEENRRGLLDAGKALSEYYQIHKVSASLPEVTVNIGVDSGTHSERIFTNVQERLEDLTRQKKEVDEKIRSLELVKEVPQQIFFDYLMLKRNILSQLNSTLTGQYEVAKISESREGLYFKVIDEARVPSDVFSPKTRRVVMATLFFSALAAMFGSVFLEYFRKSSLMAAISQQ